MGNGSKATRDVEVKWLGLRLQTNTVARPTPGAEGFFTATAGCATWKEVGGFQRQLWIPVCSWALLLKKCNAHLKCLHRKAGRTEKTQTTWTAKV